MQRALFEGLWCFPPITCLTVALEAFYIAQPQRSMHRATPRDIAGENAKQDLECKTVAPQALCFHCVQCTNSHTSAFNLPQLSPPRPATPATQSKAEPCNHTTTFPIPNLAYNRCCIIWQMQPVLVPSKPPKSAAAPIPKLLHTTSLLLPQGCFQFAQVEQQAVSAEEDAVGGIGNSGSNLLCCLNLPERQEGWVLLHGLPDELC